MTDIFKIGMLKGKIVDVSSGVKGAKESPITNFPYEDFSKFREAVDNNKISMKMPNSIRFQITGSKSKKHMIWFITMIIITIILTYELTQHYHNNYLLISLLSIPVYGPIVTTHVAVS